MTSASLPFRGRAAALILAMITCVLIWNVSAPRVLFMDFRQTYHRGAVAASQGPEAFRSRIIPRIGNPPVVFWALSPLAAIRDPWRAAWLWLGLGVVAVIATIAVLSRLSAGPAVAAALVGLVLVNGPLIYSLREGNSSHFALLLLTIGLLLRDRGLRAWTGFLWGLAALVKMPLLSLGVLFVLKRDWRGAASYGITVIGALVASVLLVGGDAMLAWGRNMLLPFLGGGVAAYNAQSLDAALLRLETGAEYLRVYDPVARSLLHKIIRAAIVLPLLASVAWTLLRRRAGTVDPLELCTIVALAFIVSPLAWAHYYTMLLLPWGLYLGGRLALPDDPVTRRLMLGSMILCSVPVLRSDIPVLHGPIAVRTLLSLCFFGGVLMLVALLRGLARGRGAESRP